MERFFNTEGPVVDGEHYCVHPLDRFDLDEVLTLIRRNKYFALHAPRQTGKTSALLALRDHLNNKGELRCVYVSIEGAEAEEDVAGAVRFILDEIAECTEESVDHGSAHGIRDQVWESTQPTAALMAFLRHLAENDPRPLVLLIDEIDALAGPPLLTVQRQLRSGYDLCPKRFPQSIVLCGVHDIRDYQVSPRGDGTHASRARPFNIIAKALRLGDFSLGQARALLSQHTSDTGQEFEESAVESIYRMTCGQPWLINALAYEACFADGTGLDRCRPICTEAIQAAKESLILNRVTHLDQIGDRLREERVRRVVEPLLAGADRHRFTSRDLDYVRDLGLIAQDAPVRIANPIYREVVPRQLTLALQESLQVDPARFRNPDGSLRVSLLMEHFQQFFREHSEHWTQRFGYEEAGPQLVLQAFLQRVVNSGGQVDLLIRWPTTDGPALRYAIECKVLRSGRGLKSVVAEGLDQLTQYMDRSGAESGHLVVFDMRDGIPWEQKISRRPESAGTRSITIWGM